MRSCCAAILGVALTLVVGCSPHSPATTRQAAVDPAIRPATPPSDAQLLHVTPLPPAAWAIKPVPPSYKAQRQVWFSPSGSTAYGVIYFHTPIPVTTQIALWGFINEMRNREGRADLIEKRKDEFADALRFVADMPQYRMHGMLVVHGTSAWVLFASTVNGQPVHSDELVQAEQACEATRPGVQ